MAYSKRPDLLFDLARAVERLCGGVVGELGEVRSVRCEQAVRLWRVCDRLSAADIDSLIARYRQGLTTRELAEHFKIGMTSVKRLLREHGVRRDGFKRSSRQSGSPGLSLVICQR
jgi:DNA-directed RNA polymerase specialized sigma24 family protein